LHSATETVPCGFICGFPTGGGGDLYGGNTYARTSRVPTSAQAEAQAVAAARWGDGPAGREQITHAVCKGKFQPWRTDGERAYGCFRHHGIRKARIERAGLRPGWESFEQWPPPFWDAVTLVLRGHATTGGEAAGGVPVGIDPPDGSVDPADGLVDPEDGLVDPADGSVDPEDGSVDPAEGSAEAWLDGSTAASAALPCLAVRLRLCGHAYKPPEARGGAI